VPWQSLGCASPFNYYTKFLVVTLTPLGMFAAMILFYLLPLYYRDRRLVGTSHQTLHAEDQSQLVHAAQKRSRRKFWKLILFTVFLMYASFQSFFQPTCNVH
jgi:hypothetical protein